VHASSKQSEPDPNAHRHLRSQQVLSDVRSQTSNHDTEHASDRQRAMHSMLSAKNAPPTLFLLLPCLHYFAHLVANYVTFWSTHVSLAFFCVKPLRCWEQYQHMCKIRKPEGLYNVDQPCRPHHGGELRSRMNSIKKPKRCAAPQGRRPEVVPVRRWRPPTGSAGTRGSGRNSPHCRRQRRRQQQRAGGSTTSGSKSLAAADQSVGGGLRPCRRSCAPAARAAPSEHPACRPEPEVRTQPPSPALPPVVGGPDDSQLSLSH
jgi:hypothetical protein